MFLKSVVFNLLRSNSALMPCLISLRLHLIQKLLDWFVVFDILIFKNFQYIQEYVKEKLRGNVENFNNFVVVIILR